MKVRATQTGFYGHLREAGDSFDIDEAGFSPRWMEKLPEPEAPKPAKAAKQPAE